VNVEDLIRAANPVATREAPPGTSPLARAILADLPSRPSRPSRAGRPVIRLTIAGLAVAGLAAGAVAIALTSAPARPVPSAGHPAAGHPASAVPAGVRGLVLAAARQPAPPVLAPGQFKYTETVSLGESDTLNDHGHTFAVDYSQHEQQWIGWNGSGRQVETSTDPTFPTPRDHAQWVADGSPSLTIGPSDQAFAARQLSNGPGKTDLATLTTDPAALARLISARRIEGGPPGPAEDFTQVGDLLRASAAPPALRAALFQVAVRIPGVTVVAGTRNHSGQPGTGLVFRSPVTSGPDRGQVDQRELIFDPATSDLIGEQAAFVNPVTKALTDLQWTDYLKSFVVTSTTSVTPIGPAQ
jgi:hypothetical protein